MASSYYRWLWIINDYTISHNLAIKSKIVVFRPPAHSIYLTQPLDAGVFQPFKHCHMDVIDKPVRLGDEKFDKLEFLAATKPSSQPLVICHALKSTGLVFTL